MGRSTMATWYRGCGLLLMGLSAGCTGPRSAPPAPAIRPTEHMPVSLTEYVANPPDILFIEMDAVPSEDQQLRPGDSLAVAIRNPLPDHPLQGVFSISADGWVDLGFYGKISVKDQTVAQAKKSIDAQLKDKLNEPDASVSLSSISPISGEYLVRPDGTVSLGFYGVVPVAGRTLTEIEVAIREHLKKTRGLEEMKLSVDVGSYNSMSYYIISDGGGLGDQVTRLPVTGQETVLDAIAELGAIPQNGSHRHIWIARPIASDPNAAEILPVDWYAITKHGAMATNYQIMPGDRLYIKADRLVKTDTVLGKLLAPVERVLGTITLFDITVDSVQRGQGGGNNNN